MCDGLMASCHFLGIISFLSRVAAVEIKSEPIKNNLAGLCKSLLAWWLQKLSNSL
jgi:hypothetical protein